MVDDQNGLAGVQSGRTPELQDWLNREIYHRLAGHLALMLRPTGISPNMVSIAGGCAVIAAGFAYTGLAWPQSALLGLMLHMAWHVIDGADGDLARMTGQSGPMGEIVDGISDYMGHIVLYCMLAAYMQPELGSMGWALMVAAGVSRIAQTNHFEVQRRRYQYWVYNRAWINSQPLVARGGVGGILTRIATIYLSLAARLDGKAALIDQLQAKAAHDPAAQNRFRDSAVRHLRPLLKPLNLLSSNHRTLVLGAAMLLRQPAWYFIYELLLNSVLIWSITAHNRAARQMAQDLAA